MLKSICMSAAILCAGMPAMATAQEALAPNPQVDYAGFVELTAELAAYREARLVSFERFREIAAQNDALVLDTRSAAAFQMGHIKGAVNLPFSDFTDEKLAKVIGDTDRPILIYCNNNFINNTASIMLKRAPLALNIPTFINLYGYGYQNIYELNDVVDANDPDVEFVRMTLPIPARDPNLK